MKQAFLRRMAKPRVSAAARVAQVRQRGSIIFCTAAFVLLFFACTPCDHYYEPRDSMATVLVEHPVCNFVDSSGQTLQMVYMSSGSNDLETTSAEGRCQSIETLHYPNFNFQFLPPNGRDFSYSQIYDVFSFTDFGAQYHSGDYDGPIYSYHQGDTILTIQGHQYENCWASTYSDSLGLRHFFAVDRTHGLVAFQYRQEYRWERVLD